MAAASIVAASYRHDAVLAHNLGFMGTAYSATHEATELILKIYIAKCLGGNPREFRDHHLGRMFDAWANEDREGAELAYQKEVRDGLVGRFQRASWAAAGLDVGGVLPSDFDERRSVYEARVADWRKQLLGKTPSAGEVVSELDRLLGVPNIRELCGPYATSSPGYPRAPEHVYTSEFLEMEWRVFCAATEKGESLGLVRALLHREGSSDVFQGWRYLAEGRLADVGVTFHGPPGRMIRIAQCLDRYVWDRLETSAGPA